MGLWETWRERAIGLSDWKFWRGFMGATSTSGECVTIESTLSLDAAWACVNLKSDTISTLPCMVYDRNTSQVLSEHPLHELLHDQPNADDTAPEFWSMAVMSLCTDGNFFAEKKMSGGRVVALLPLHPLWVEVLRQKGGRYYRVTEHGKVREISAADMFHVRGAVMPGCDRGISPVSFLRNTVGNALAAEKTAGRMFANGMMASGVVTSDQVLKSEQRQQIREMLEQYSGSDKAGKLAVLEAGLKYQQLTFKPQDAQMLETRQFSVEQVCRVFGTPPVMIGHAANGTTTWGSGIEQLILQYVKSCLRPTLKKIEAAIRRDLLTQKERQTIKVEFNLEGLLRGDSAARAAFYSTMVQNGIYDRNFVRGLENQPARPEANDLTAQTNLAPLAKLGQPVGPATQVGQGIAALVQEALETSTHRSTSAEVR